MHLSWLRSVVTRVMARQASVLERGETAGGGVRFLAFLIDLVACDVFSRAVTLWDRWSDGHVMHDVCLQSWHGKFNEMPSSCRVSLLF